MSAYATAKQAVQAFSSDPLQAIQTGASSLADSLAEMDVAHAIQTGGPSSHLEHLDAACDWLFDDEAVAGPDRKVAKAGPSTPQTLTNQIFGAPASQFTDGVARSGDPVVEAAPDTSSKSLRVGLQGGNLIVGGATEHTVGPLKGTLDGAVDVVEGRAGGQVGLTMKTRAGEVGGGVNGGVDLGADGIEGVSMGGKAQVGTLSATAGVGVSDKVTDPVLLPDGTYQVAWSSGVGGAAGISSPAGGASVGLSSASVSTRTFQSKEDAEAFAAWAAERDEAETSWTADDVQTMKPGEKIVIDSSGGIDGGLTSSGLGGADLGVSFSQSSGLELEKLQGDSVRATQKSGWNLGGTLGAAANFLGVSGALGLGNDSALEVDFDLSKPGACAAFEEFQRTGELPEKLPDGVSRVGSKDVDYSTHAGTKRFFGEIMSEEGRQEWGTHAIGDDEFTYAGATRREKHERWWGWGDKELISSEEHKLATLHDGETAMMRSQDTYTGQGARDAVLGNGSVEEEDLPALGPDGTYVVDTAYNDLAEKELAHRAFLKEAGEDGGLAVFDVNQQRGFDDLTEQLANTGDGPDLDGLANYAAGNRDANEMLRMNLGNETTTISGRKRDPAS